MGLLDRLVGRGKKAAGDLLNDPKLRREGVRQERERAGEARKEGYSLPGDPDEDPPPDRA